ncbi:hypothetical protein [Nosocomiicoccus ampullae]|uniref:hypothetical protein n=1 Tax=Nosocomiicoccus ampullae TaxID=489910 RepID=UPI00254F904C|nr:hypothetical protein [Nosocomiicoccus ampullae]MDK6862748.1 hypothetical protein [Nosocomiicoccus ampullae]
MSSKLEAEKYLLNQGYSNLKYIKGSDNEFYYEVYKFPYDTHMIRIKDQGIVSFNWIVERI